MLSTTLVLAGLSSGQKIGLATVGGAFIVFSLISSMVLPQRYPNFPGRNGVRWYVLLGTLFVIATLSSVIVFGKEKEEKGAAETTTEQTTTSGSTTPAPPPPSGQGDAAAGKTVFASAGCESCHTLKDAGAKGTVGPNLDELKPSFDAVKRQVTNGGGGMPSFKSQLKPKQIDDVAAYVSSVAGK
jgi:mono/diheme cytochrome c family protein